jgi:hypothetical protein
MRFCANLSTVLAAVVLLALPAVAAAGPKPILKPPATTPAKTPTHVTPAKAPVSHTQTNTSSGSTSSSASTSGSTTGSTGTRTPVTGTNTTTPPATVTPKVILGGRDHANDFVAAVPATVTPQPSPTPLAFVAIGDRLPSTSTPTPAWKLALLALLAAAEAFLVVRLVRSRPGGTLTPAS